MFFFKTCNANPVGGADITIVIISVYWGLYNTFHSYCLGDYNGEFCEQGLLSKPIHTTTRPKKERNSYYVITILYTFVCYSIYYSYFEHGITTGV